VFVLIVLMLHKAAKARHFSLKVVWSNRALPIEPVSHRTFEAA
jgi:hypothetical protein